MPSSNYTGSGSAGARPPSAAPAPGVAPTISYPADGDNGTIESILQQMEVSADFLAYIQACALLDYAAVASAGNGFTAVTYSSFGGTVTPADFPNGSAKIATGTRFVIKIIVGGAAGTATFQTSVDGGNTFGATQTTSNVAMTDATSGITLTFAGTLTANGTASFTSAFTPQARWRDALGNVRSLIDHNGYRTGRTTEFAENWSWFVNGMTDSTTYPSATGGPWEAFHTANCAVSTLGSDTTLGTVIPTSAMLLIQAISGVNTNYGRLYTRQPILAVQAYSSIVWEWEMAMSVIGANNVTIGAGFANTTTTDAMSSFVVGFVKRSTDTNWQAMTQGGGTTLVDSQTPPVANTPQRFRIEIHGSSSPYGAVCLFFINDARVASVTAHNPSVGLGLSPGFTMDVTGSANTALYVSPLRIVWNRVASLSPL